MAYDFFNTHHEVQLIRTEMHVIRWTCGIKSNEIKQVKTVRIGTSKSEDEEEKIETVWTC